MKNIKIIDYFVIVVQICFGLSLVDVFLFSLIPLPLSWSLFLFQVIVFFIRFKKGPQFFIIIPKSFIFSILFLIYFVDFFFNLIQSRLYLDTFFLMLNGWFFLEYLYALYNSNNDLSVIVKPYRWYSLYNVGVVFLSAVLIMAGVLSPTTNEISSNALIVHNVEENHTYYFPGYLSVALDSSRAFGNIPVLCGLSHEPHVLCFLIMPAFFISQLFVRKKIYRSISLVSVLFILALSTSSTAIITFAIVFALDLLWSIFVNNKKSNILSLALLLLLFFIYGGQIIGLLSNEVLMKTTTATGSMDYSLAMLAYILSPSGIIGYGNLPPAIGFSIVKYNIGLITTILDIILFCTMLFMSLRLVFSSNQKKHLFGLAFLYFTLHMLKINILVFNYPYLIFILFLLYIVYNERNIEKKHIP